MDRLSRTATYERQNGDTTRLSPRQRRRIKHKDNRVAAQIEQALRVLGAPAASAAIDKAVFGDARP